ncbi:glucose 1-dehydrogenase [Staphylococcus haemolyticus]|uniref:SDR family NAD(P)-dependent oxidoreductase n=1 Tax=Staphylococcus haemolyticus TaxID=1283 RepID=UPI001CA4B163|nr:glucose 1-dehydrogenase [Staphylococcus haemolyticus]MBW5903052.1 glucose 1-dehydrogenase [Staphylococcus haemolyticus]MCH4471365.1 glucose 1-dehydrogenase [Staphylococcus haemolyticus]MCH4492543.1 glucose 1-dehydrogenase [Staphylococcus haemolyticus]
MGKLDGKVAFITGAGSGMGKAQVILYASEGAKVIIADINEETVNQTASDIKAHGGEALPVTIDVSNKESVDHAVKQGVEAFGTINILSNTAGILDDYKPTLETSEELWDRIININLKGTYLVTNAVLPHMIDNGKGTVINIASIGAFVTGGGGAAYTSAKHGIAGYTKQLSFDYGLKGIKANAIAPGAVDTGMTHAMFEEGSADVMKKTNSVPAGRYGQPEEIAQLSLFLASDDSDFIHGSIIPIDGGWLVD